MSTSAERSCASSGGDAMRRLFERAWRYGVDVSDTDDGELRAEVASVAAPASWLPCPRCGRPGPAGRFYGPCEGCVGELGATMRLAPREVERELYVPKPNVVANHVATKE